MLKESFPIEFSLLSSVLNANVHVYTYRCSVGWKIVYALHVFFKKNLLFPLPILGLHPGALLYTCDHCVDFSTNSAPSFRSHVLARHSRDFATAYEAERYVRRYFAAEA